MSNYDYKNAKERIEEILDNKIEIIEGKIPQGDSFTFSNAYYGWVTGIFIDIRDSTTLFSEEDKEEVSKIIRSFTSEVIEILRDVDDLREIGVRGDCVYAIYATPYNSGVLEIADKAFYVNTFMRMLNDLLEERYFPTIKVGIGIATAQELVVKAGRKGVGINNNVWIGEAVTKASNLSSLGDKNGVKSIVLSSVTYNSIIAKLKDRNSEKYVEGWFTKHYDDNLGTYYEASIIKSEFDEWISEGMN